MSGQLPLFSVVPGTTSEPHRTSNPDGLNTNDSSSPELVPNHLSNSSMISRFRTTSPKGEIEPGTTCSNPGSLQREKRVALDAPLSLPESRADVPAPGGQILVSADQNRFGTTPEPDLRAAPNQLRLRPYQVTSIERVEGEFARGIKRTLLVLPTGCGKTIVFAQLLQRILAAIATGARGLVLAHRTELLDQALEKLLAIGVRAAVEQGDRRASSSAQVVVASVQTMRGARLARFMSDDFGFIVVDEAHHSEAAGYQSIFEHFPNARILGVTATPDRADGKPLGKTYQSIAFTYEMRRAIADGWLAPIRARRIRITDVDMSAIKAHHGDLAQDELSAVLREAKALHGVVSPLVRLAGDRKTLVFGVDVAHAHALTEMLNRDRPGSAIALDGKAPTAQRRGVLDLFRRGAFQYLVNCALFTEGFDEPSIQCVALARPTMSRALYTQMVGRGTRLLGLSLEESIGNGKPECLLLDFVGNTRHRLAGPADALAGMMLPEDLQAEVDADLANGKTADIELVLAGAEERAAEKAREKALLALAHYRVKEIDPFLGDQMPPLDPDSPAAKKPATDAQLAAIEKANLGKPPPGMTLGEASALLDAVAERRRLGLASIAQCKVLTKLGLETKTMSLARAGQLMGKAQARGFKPWVFAHEPEFKRSR